ncbi:MAG: glycoside hydrolase family 32 protein, partial [Atopobiaceae bacterium]|nr:glycoside hydrolase family 32 protein [Atopobiaceae bacterium]
MTMLVKLVQSHNWRLKFHLQMPHGTMTDPNGLSHFKGVYHIFHQYEPRWPREWGHGWGHWSSPDLLTWYWHGGAIMPSVQTDKNGSYSGSGIVNGDELWLYYTGNELMGSRADGYDYDFSGRKANETLVITKDGVTMGEKRPVLLNDQYPAYASNHVRDPKVWREDGSWWMLLGCRTMDSHGCALLYKSDDGLKWEMAGSATNTGDGPFGYMWECPSVAQFGDKEFMFVCPQGVPKQEYRFQTIHNSGYFPVKGKVIDILQQDPGKMDADGPYPCMDVDDFVELDFGFDFYACQVFEDEFGRHILIAWAGVADMEFEYDVPTTPEWAHTLTIPRELKLNKAGKVCQWPVKELEQLRDEEVEFKPELAHGSTGFMGSSTYDKFDMTGHVGARFDGIGEFQITNIEGKGHFMLNGDLEFVINDDDAELVFHSHAGRYRSIRRIPFTALSAGKVENLRVLVDTSVVEIFVNDGEATMTTRWFPLDIKNLAVTSSLKGDHKA